MMTQEASVLDEVRKESFGHVASENTIDYNNRVSFLESLLRVSRGSLEGLCQWFVIYVQSANGKLRHFVMHLSNGSVRNKYLCCLTSPSSVRLVTPHIYRNQHG